MKSRKLIAISIAVFFCTAFFNLDVIYAPNSQAGSKTARQASPKAKNDGKEAEQETLPGKADADASAQSDNVDAINLSSMPDVSSSPGDVQMRESAVRSETVIPLSAARELEMRAQYEPWEVRVPPGSALDRLIKSVYSRRVQRIPALDLEDQQPLPLWFRAYLREGHPLPADGRYQYRCSP